MSGEKKEKGQLKMLPVIIGAAVGVLLLIYGGTLGGASTEENNTKVSAEITSFDEAKYEEELVKKIEDVCARVKGAGKVSVALTLDGSYRAVYAQNSSHGSSVRQEYLLVGSGSSETALLLGYSAPEILGVGIVCTGGANDKVRAEITSLVAALLDVPTNKIYVTGARK